MKYRMRWNVSFRMRVTIAFLCTGNPLYDSLEEATWRVEAVKRLPNLKKLDGEPVISEVV